VLHFFFSSRDFSRAVKLLHKANGLCLVSRALSIKITFNPTVKIAAAAAGLPA
jgi:hypothetical protein